MDLHQLNYLRVVAEEQSFTRAAQRLFVTQPNVSIQIRKLEREIGTALVERVPGSARLSPAGHVLNDCARSIFTILDDTMSKIGELSDRSAGAVRIGYLPSLGGSIVPAIVAVLKRAVPEIVLALREIADSERIRDMLTDGELDVGVGRLPHTEGVATSRVLFSEEFVVACPATGPLRGWKFGEVDDFALAPFVLPVSGIGLRKQILDICRSMGFAPTVVLEAQRLDLLVGAVARGVGISLLPRMCLDREAGITPVELRHQSATRTISLAWRRQADPFRRYPGLTSCLSRTDFAAPLVREGDSAPAPPSG